MSKEMKKLVIQNEEFEVVDAASRNGVTVANSRIDQLVAGTNITELETTLWTGNAGRKNDAITLSESAANYDYVDVYYFYNGRHEIKTFTSHVFLTTEMVIGSVNVNNEPDTTNPLLASELIFAIDGSETSYKITHANQWSWDGVAANAASQTSPSTDYQAGYIYKIVGRKIITNTEVEDIRIGYDGTEYGSAGEAVRSQIEEAMASGGALTEEIKHALLNCFEHVAWVDAYGQTYVDALESALYPPVDLASISAVYTQSGTVYDTDSLDDLKSDLVVTAAYDDSSTETITNYTLSGTLTEGTSTITASYGGKIDTFDVTVTHKEQWDFEWDYTDGTPNDNDIAETWTGGSGHASGLVNDGYYVAGKNGIKWTGKLAEYDSEVLTAGGGVVEATFYVPTNTENSRNYYANINIGDGTNGIRVMFLNNNVGGSGTGKFVELLDGANWYSGTKILNSWSYDTEYTCRIEFDSANVTGKVYINGTLVADNVTASTSMVVNEPFIYTQYTGADLATDMTVWKSFKVRYGLS